MPMTTIILYNLYNAMCVVLSNSVMSNSLRPTRLLCPCRFSRQEYWSGQLCPPLGDLPNPGIKPSSAIEQVDSLPSEPPGKLNLYYIFSHFSWQGKSKNCYSLWSEVEVSERLRDFFKTMILLFTWCFPLLQWECLSLVPSSFQLREELGHLGSLFIIFCSSFPLIQLFIPFFFFSFPFMW